MIRPFIEVGDRVKLRFGGQAMTVNALVESKAVCFWHDKMSRLQQETFDLALLKVANPGQTDGYRDGGRLCGCCV